ncbi:MAG: hypothetical protein U1E65_00305 [Myxococcota bacterium]
MKTLAASSTGQPTVVLEEPAFPKASVEAIASVDPKLASELRRGVDVDRDGWVGLSELALLASGGGPAVSIVRRYYQAVEALGAKPLSWHGKPVRPHASLPLNGLTGAVGGALAVGLGLKFGLNAVEFLTELALFSLAALPFVGRDRELPQTVELMHAEANGIIPRAD